MTLDDRRVGDAIASSAGELVRLWRATRSQSRRGVWPGLLDGLVDDIFVRTGEALAAGRDPALVWPSLVGLVRIDPHARERSRVEIDAEWDVIASVLSAACEAMDAGEGAGEWLARAVVFARTGSRALDQGGGPPGVVVAWVLSGLQPARRAVRESGQP